MNMLVCGSPGLQKTVLNSYLYAAWAALIRFSIFFHRMHLMLLTYKGIELVQYPPGSVHWWWVCWWLMSRSCLKQDHDHFHFHGESVTHLRSREVVRWVLEVIRHGSVIIGVLALSNLSFFGSSPELEPSYVEKTAIGALSKVDCRVAVWDFLKHCLQADG